MSLINIVNELTTSNINGVINFYKDIFGFKIEFQEGTPITWVQLRKDNVRMMVEDYQTVKKEMKKFPPKNNSSNLIKFEYDNFDEFQKIYEKCKTNMCSFFMDYTEMKYGKIEFGVIDEDKNMILVSFIK